MRRKRVVILATIGAHVTGMEALPVRVAVMRSDGGSSVSRGSGG